MKPVMLFFVACVVGCAASETPPDPPSLTKSNATTERCSPSEIQFQLVGGPEYVGVIIPGSYFATPGGRDEKMLARSLGITASGTWTPTAADVELAETGIRDVLGAGIQDPVALDRYARGNSARARVIKNYASSILQNLPKYRRQYAGLVVGGHRQVLCRFFMPEANMFPRWQCQYVSGDDFGELLWDIRYDLDTKRHTGFEVG